MPRSDVTGQQPLRMRWETGDGGPRGGKEIRKGGGETDGSDGWKNRSREARKEGGKGSREEGNSRWRWKDREKLRI